MKNLYTTSFIFIFGFLLSQMVSAQEEQLETEQDSIVNTNADSSFQQAFFKALSQRGIENYDKSVEILSQLEKENSDKPVIYFQLGLNYFDLEQYSRALVNLEKADKLKPDDYDIKEAIFKIHEQQKNYPRAINYAKYLAPKNAEYYEILANLYLMTKAYEDALKSLKKADELQGFDVHKDKVREIIFKEYSQPKVAIEYYKKRIEQEPYNPINKYRLVRFLIADESYEEALKATKNALNTHPEFSRYYVLQTQIYVKLEQIDLALQAIENVVKDRFLEENYKVEAINSFKSYVETHPETEDDFIEILNVASQTAKDNSSFLDLGLYYYETDKARSLENFKKAKAQNPQDFQILKYICILHYELNQYEEAIASAENALEIYPTQAIFMLVKGEAYVEQTQYNKAKSVLLEALSYVFEENEMMKMIYEGLSRAYLGLNEPEKAQEYQDKAEILNSKLN
jgi:tetratricopeptide (TPR) repeat protein